MICGSQNSAARISASPPIGSRTVPVSPIPYECRKPLAATADTGYFSAGQINDPRVEGIDLYIAIAKQKHGEPEAGADTEPVEPPAETEPAKEEMKRKLKTETGKALYKMRKAIVEPVFGQIKAARGIRAFLLRGIEKASAEWKLICATHNLLKLFRAAAPPQAA